jgi:sodium/bile acid cotransporter 7
MRSSTSSDGAVSLQPLTPSTSNAQSSGPRGRLSGLSTSQPRIKSQHQQSTQSQSSDSTASRSSSASRIYQALRWFCVDQWFLIALSCLIILSSQVQVPAVRQKTKETAVTYACVSLIFFITGCTLPTKVLMENYAKWKIHLFVQVQSYLMTSATTFAVVSICATNPNFMDPWLLIGLIFAGCVPTTISSNVVMTRQAHGNTALTVVQSTIGNFLGPFLTPVLVKMYTSTGAWYTRVLPTATGGYGEIYRRVFKQLGLSLFLPMTVGQIVQNVFPSATKKVMADWKLSKLGSLSLLVIIWQTFDQAFETGAFESVKGSNMVFIVFISLAFYAIWLGIGFGTAMLWLPKKDVIAAWYV